MSPLKLSLTTAALAALSTSAGFYGVEQYRQHELAQLRRENSQLRAQGTRPQVASSQQADHPAAGSVIPAEAVRYRNEGQATPLATLQTVAWTCDQSDSVLMEKLLIYDPAARERAMTYIASLPAAERAKSRSIEAVAADLYVIDGMQIPYPVAAMLERARFEPIAADRVMAHLAGGNGDRYQFQHTAEGWKLVVTMKVVEDYIQGANKRRAMSPK